MQLINLVFVDGKTAERLNKKYRGQDYTPTVLSFCYNDGQATIGEIIICLSEAKKQNLTLEKLVNHGLKNLLSQIPAAKLSKLGFTRDSRPTRKTS